MTRKRMFRAWNEKSKTLYYDVCIDMYGHASSNGQYLTYDLEADFVDEFIGLVDKNGNKIFENDILCKTHRDKPDFVGVVEYEPQNAAFVFRSKPRWTGRPGRYSDFISCGQTGGGEYIQVDVEIIGNIHENPERMVMPVDTNVDLQCAINNAVEAVIEIFPLCAERGYLFERESVALVFFDRFNKLQTFGFGTTGMFIEMVCWDKLFLAEMGKYNSGVDENGDRIYKMHIINPNAPREEYRDLTLPKTNK